LPLILIQTAIFASVPAGSLKIVSFESEAYEYPALIPSYYIALPNPAIKGVSKPLIDNDAYALRKSFYADALEQAYSNSEQSLYTIVDLVVQFKKAMGGNYAIS